MNNAELVETKKTSTKKEAINWKDSPSIQRLLDVISSILAEEYITIAKQNPEVFLNNIPRLSELRGCAPSRQGETK